MKREDAPEGKVRTGSKRGNERYAAFKRIMHKSKQPITVMVAPHDEAKVMHFRVSLLAIWIGCVVAVALVAGVILFSTGFFVTGAKAARSGSQSLKLQASLNEIRGEVNDLSQVTEVFKEIAGSTAKAMNPGKAVDTDVGVSQGDLSQIYSFRGSESDSDEVRRLGALKVSLQKLIPQIKGIRDSFDSQRALLTDIPTGWPLGGGITGYVSQPFGPTIDPFTGEWQFHTGDDIAYGYGTPEVASADGTVVRADFNPGGYGLYVMIRHKYGYYTLYAHMQRFVVHVGQRLKRGDLVGLMGSTGRATGPHCHFEIRLGTDLIDPMTYLSIANPAYSRYIRDKKDLVNWGDKAQKDFDGWIK